MRRRRRHYRLYDTTDAATGFSSMARTTGYTATAVARLVLDGAFTRQGHLSAGICWARNRAASSASWPTWPSAASMVECRTEARRDAPEGGQVRPIGSSPRGS